MRAIKTYIIILSIAAVCLSGYKLFKMSERYIQEAQVKDRIAAYLPSDDSDDNSYSYIEADILNDMPEPQNNQFIIDLREEINKDIIGWLTIPETQINYPFVISNDNSHYLRRDLYGNYALAGTIFTDHRCSKEFDNFNTVIYGHNMNNGSMFGELQLFDDEGFFDNNRFGTIYTEDNTYTLEFFACMIVKADDKYIFDISVNSKDFFDYVKKSALNYREPDINKNVVTLSTCTSSYQTVDTRTVLLANIIKK